MHEILIGFSLTYWTDNAFIEGIEQISHSGFPGFEGTPHLVDRYEDRLEVFSEILDRTDVELISIFNNSNFLIEEKMEEEVEIDMNVVRFLHNVGAQFLVVTCGPRRPEGNTEDDWKNLIEALDELGSRALDSSIQLCVQSCHGTIIETKKEIDRLMESTKEGKVFLSVDLAALRAKNIEAVKLVDQYFDRIPYIRLRDGLDRKMMGRPRLINRARDNKLEFNNPVGVQLGTGLSDLRGVWDLLNDREFEGWVMAVVEEPKNAAENVMKQTREYLEMNMEIIF